MWGLGEMQIYLLRCSFKYLLARPGMHANLFLELACREDPVLWMDQEYRLSKEILEEKRSAPLGLPPGIQD